MNRQRVKFSVTFPDYDRSEDVWIGGRVDALSGVEAIERATKRGWESWLRECSGDFPVRAIATDPDGREWSVIVPNQRLVALSDLVRSVNVTGVFPVGSVLLEWVRHAITAFSVGLSLEEFELTVYGSAGKRKWCWPLVLVDIVHEKQNDDGEWEPDGMEIRINPSLPGDLDMFESDCEGMCGL